MIVQHVSTGMYTFKDIHNKFVILTISTYQGHSIAVWLQYADNVPHIKIVWIHMNFTWSKLHVMLFSHEFHIRQIWLWQGMKYTCKIINKMQYRYLLHLYTHQSFLVLLILQSVVQFPGLPHCGFPNLYQHSLKLMTQYALNNVCSTF